MDIHHASDLIRRYYLAFRADTSDGVARALADVLAPTFILDSPLVRDRMGGPASGEVAIAIAKQAASVLCHAEIDSLYFTADNIGVVALIQIPIPGARIWQSEHFAIDTPTGAIASLRSFYDPRVLLESRPESDPTVEA